MKFAALIAGLLLLAGCAGGASGSYQNMSVEDLRERMETEDLFVVDVHIPEQQHIAGTDLFIPFDQVADNADRFPADKDETIVVYCRSGNMSIDASLDLIQMGYKNVFNVPGGMNAWKAAGYPVDE